MSDQPETSDINGPARRSRKVTAAEFMESLSQNWPKETTSGTTPPTSLPPTEGTKAFLAAAAKTTYTPAPGSAIVDGVGPLEAALAVAVPTDRNQLAKVFDPAG